MTKKSKYAEKLKDPRWQKKRLEVMERDQFTCRDCGSKDKTFHVHNCLYIYGREPWEYRNEELRTLCWECHEERASLEHDVVLEFKRHLASMDQEEMSNVMDCFLSGGCLITVYPPDWPEA